MRNDRALCVAQCVSRGFHADDCPGGDCQGCVPRLAADGVLLCRWHLAKLGEDPVEMANLYDEIGLRLAGSGSAGEKTSGTPNRGLAINERAVETRDYIRAVLRGWAEMICEELGVTRPVDEVRTVAEFVARHANWLAASAAAADASNELRDWVRRAYSVAYPSGSRVFEVAGCPMHDCDGTIRAIVRRTDALLPSSLVCDTDESHTWPADRWLSLGRELRKREAA